MVSTYSTQPFSMTADTSRSAISPLSEEQNARRISDVVSETKIKSELSWSQLVHAEIIGKSTYDAFAFYKTHVLI
jgi:hypothetical protein